MGVSKDQLGKIALINLSSGKISQTPVKKYQKLFIGGRGVNVKLLHELTTPKIDPYDPQTPLIFGVGALTGSGAPSANRMSITSKSPITGFFGDTTRAKEITVASNSAVLDASLVYAEVISCLY